MMGVVETAKSYIGKVNYVFGADNIDGGSGDCSSFTKTVFEKNGFSIGRDTETQWTSAGGKIDRNLIVPGDLVFFKNTYNSNHTDGVSHVGIATSKTSFIHLGSKGVTESDLNSNYWNEHFLGAKRVVGATSSEGSSSSEGSVIGSEIGLEWWGDIVKVILIALLLIAAVVLFVVGIKSEIM